MISVKAWMPTGADVGFLPDGGIPQIAELPHFYLRPQAGVLDLHEIADLGSPFQVGTGSQVGKGPDLHALTENCLLQHGIDDGATKKRKKRMYCNVKRRKNS